MKQIIGITKVKDPYKFICLLKRDHPNTSNNKFNELIHHINNNNFIWYLSCEENKIKSISEYCNLFIQSSKHMKQNQFEFKAFDKVLVRNTKEQTWKPNFYSFEGYNSNGHVCTNDMTYAQCIPYNENTAHLVGTNKPYKDELFQEKKIHVWTTGTFNEWMTEDEFKNFINTAVMHNKDITDFHVLYIP